MYSVTPAASLPTPSAMVQYGVAAVPGPASEQETVLSTYRTVVAPNAVSGYAASTPDSTTAPVTRPQDFMVPA